MNIESAASVMTCVARSATELWEEIGSGHHEGIYRTGLAYKLSQHFRGVAEEVTVPVLMGRTRICIGHGLADIVIGGVAGQRSAVVVELKTIPRKLNDQHRKQLKAYMRGLQAGCGVLINFPNSGLHVHPEIETINYAEAAA